MKKTIIAVILIVLAGVVPALAIMQAISPGASCVVTETPETSCADGIDNDCDGHIDGADSDCGGGSVLYDTVATVGSSSVDVESLSTSITLAGDNGAVAVSLVFRDAVPGGLTVSVGGQSASAVSGATSNESDLVSVIIYGVAMGSASGSQTVSASWTGARYCGLAAVAFTRVDQTTPFQNGAGASYAYGVTAASLAITSAVNNMTLDVVTNRSNDAITGNTQTERYNFNASSAGLTMAGSTAAGSPSNTHAWTISGDRGAHAGVSVNAF